MSESDALEMKLPDEGVIADAARRIASWAEGYARLNVYAAAKHELTRLSSPPPAVGGEVERVAEAIRAGWNQPCPITHDDYRRIASLAIAALTPQGGQKP